MMLFKNRLTRSLSGWLAAFVLSGLAYPLQAASQSTVKLEESSARHEQGRKIYNFRCYYCHGYSGNAKTLTSSFLNPKPRDFTQLTLDKPGRESMLISVRDGHPGTGMAGFANILNSEEIGFVVDFVRHEFIAEGKENTRYHTRENGWPDHDRYTEAFPFATGEIALDSDWNKLTPSQRQGKQLFLDTCITCHDRSRVMDEGPIWEPSAVSFPRNNTFLDYRQPDDISEASVYARHDIVPKLTGLTAKEKHGESLYQENCAFCHAADGTGRNWIGIFLEPHPRDLTDPKAMTGMTPANLKIIIQEGLPNTTMPAWKNVLNEDEIKSIIAYINRAFFPVQKNTAIVLNE